MREILSEASRLIRNRHFALAVLIMLIAFSGYAACDWVFMYDWDVAYRSSSLQQTLGGIYFGGAMLVVPLCAALPAGLAQVEELQTNFIDYRIIRSSMPRYEVTKLASAFLASGAAIALSFVFHALIWNILATPCNPLENDYLAVPFADDCIFAPWQEIFYSLPIYLWIAAAVFFCGGVWGMASVTAAMYTRDKLLSIAVPFCVYFLWSYGFPRVVLGVKRFPHPADLYNDGLTWNGVFSALLAYGVLIVLLNALYGLRLFRRYRHGE